MRHEDSILAQQMIPRRMLPLLILLLNRGRGIRQGELCRGHQLLHADSGSVPWKDCNPETLETAGTQTLPNSSTLFSFLTGLAMMAQKDAIIRSEQPFFRLIRLGPLIQNSRPRKRVGRGVAALLVA